MSRGAGTTPGRSDRPVRMSGAMRSCKGRYVAALRTAIPPAVPGVSVGICAPGASSAASIMSSH